METVSASSQYCEIIIRVIICTLSIGQQMLAYCSKVVRPGFPTRRIEDPFSDVVGYMLISTLMEPLGCASHIFTVAVTFVVINNIITLCGGRHILW